VRGFTGVAIALLVASLLIGSFVMVAGDSFEYSFQGVYSGERLSVTRVLVGLDVVDGVVIIRYDDFSRSPVMVISEDISRIVGGGLEQSDYAWMERVGYNDVLRDLYSGYPSLGGVYPVSRDTYILVMMGSDESEVQRQVLSIAGEMRSRLGLRSINIYYFTVPIDPYVPAMDIYTYSDLYSSLLASGEVPEYVFMFTITRGVPEFGAWQSCSIEGSKVTHDYYDIVNGVRSLADKMFGEDSRVFLHLVSMCGGLEPLINQGSRQEPYIQGQLVSNVVDDDREAVDPTDNGSLDTDGEVTSPYPYITILIGLSIAIPTVYLLLRRVSEM